jgi:hypothetical protein
MINSPEIKPIENRLSSKIKLSDNISNLAFNNFQNVDYSLFLLDENNMSNKSLGLIDVDALI